MPNYHLYVMSKGAPVSVTSIEAGDEAEAVRIARELNERELKEGDAIELWNEHRRLRVLVASRPAMESLAR